MDAGIKYIECHLVLENFRMILNLFFKYDLKFDLKICFENFKYFPILFGGSSKEYPHNKVQIEKNGNMNITG